MPGENVADQKNLIYRKEASSHLKELAFLIVIIATDVYSNSCHKLIFVIMTLQSTFQELKVNLSSRILVAYAEVRQYLPVFPYEY